MRKSRRLVAGSYKRLRIRKNIVVTTDGYTLQKGTFKVFHSLYTTELLVRHSMS
jgi:hypothetical protein